MKTLDSRDQYEALRALLQQAADAYHGGDEPIMDDAEYDESARLLAEAERVHPEWAAEAPFSQQVGGGKVRLEVQHAKRMLSLDNIFTTEELLGWRQRLGEDVPVVVEPKLDGLAVSVTYRSGLLQRIATRGDGSTGEDVTSAPVHIKGLPKTLNEPADLEVRGEICMTASDFEEASELRTAEGRKPLSNPRNAAAGAMMALPGRQPVPVTFWAYDLVEGGDHADSFDRMRQLGIAVSLDVWSAGPGEGVEDAITRLQKQRGTLPVSIDGAVIKASRVEDRNIGSTSRAPRWAVAYKFPAEMRRSRILSIDLQVGRGGSITPVAKIEPVSVGGAEVRSVNLHNPNDIARKDIRVGDVVYVRRAGDVIPEIVGPVEKERTEDVLPWKAPTLCPQCRAKVDRSGGRMRCPSRCGRVRGLVWAAGRSALDIEGAGSEMVSAAFEAGIISDVASLYELDTKESELAELTVNGRRFGESRAARVAAAAGRARSLPGWRHLAALGVGHMGVATSKAAVAAFGGLEQAMQAVREQLEQVEGIGPVVAASLHTELQQRADEIRRVLSAVLPAEENEEEARGGVLEGKRIAVSGTFKTLSRSELISRIEAAGGRISGTVSRATDALVKGEGGGGKMRDAERHEVTVLTEHHIIDILEGERKLP